MPEIPAFLADFISHRKHSLKEQKPEEKKKLLKGISVAKDKTLDTSVDGIIDKRPSRKVVEEYFQNKCDELSKEKMK